MITRTPSYKTDDGEVFASLEAAQIHELISLMDGDSTKDQKHSEAVWIVSNRDKILDILTTTEKSKVRARAVNGGTKKRTPKPATTPATPATT